MRSLLRNLLPARVRSHRILAGPLRGYRIRTAWRDYPRAILGRAEADLLAWFDAHVHAGETWLDVGAYYGYTSLALALRVGSSGRVFSFEPVLSVAGHLAATRADSGLAHWTVVPLALDSVAELTLQKTATYRGMAQMIQGPGKSEPVYALAFDRFWPRVHGGEPRVHGVKMDVQGLESRVLRGMAEMLRRERPRLVVEYHVYAPLDDLLAALTEAGYRTEGEPVDRTGTPVDGSAPDRWVHECNYEFRPA